MGRETLCHAEWPDGAGEVKALLETRALILRGALRRTLKLDALENVRVAGDTLTFRHRDEVIALHLGNTMAARWAQAIATPPPTLAAKLGVSGAVIRIVGEIDDPDLQAALAEAGSGPAALTIAQVADRTSLDRAVALADGPLWLAYVKGKASAYGEAAVRDAMRGRGWIDIKVASVSDRLTATKFVRRADRDETPP